MNTGNSVDVQLQNWENFCRYHTGDWHGIWTRYSSDGKAFESLKCVRCFHASEDSSQVDHENRYTYANGKTETKTFGPYKLPISKILFLDNAFSMGSTIVQSSSSFASEIGFRYENRRASATFIYSDNGRLQRITLMPEYLAGFTQELVQYQAFDNDKGGNCQGTRRVMTSDLMTLSEVSTTWNRLEELGKDYLVIHHTDGISVSCPRQIEAGKDFFLAADWRINDVLLQRGIRHFDTSGFVSFTLEVFTLVS